MVGTVIRRGRGGQPVRRHQCAPHRQRCAASAGAAELSEMGRGIGDGVVIATARVQRHHCARRSSAVGFARAAARSWPPHSPTRASTTWRKAATAPALARGASWERARPRAELCFGCRARLGLCGGGGLIDMNAHRGQQLSFQLAVRTTRNAIGMLIPSVRLLVVAQWSCWHGRHRKYYDYHECANIYCRLSWVTASRPSQDCGSCTAHGASREFVLVTLPCIAATCATAF